MFKSLQPHFNLLFGCSSIILDDELSVLQAQIEDKGTYVCTVTNPAGSASRAVALDVSGIILPTSYFTSPIPKQNEAMFCEE